MIIGILGTRGIPNAYGGFEQFAQWLARGLAEKGHAVTVYNSSEHPYKEPVWNGVRLIHCRDWESRIGTAGQFLYDYNCLRDARRRDYDILLQLGYTSNSIWHFIWPRKAVNIINMDGLEWKRSKYSRPVQKFLLYAEKLAAKKGDLLVADSPGIREYLSEKYGRPSAFIPYGAEPFETPDPAALEKFGLLPSSYYLLVARIEPENNIEMIIQGWLASAQERPLVIVGNASNPYGRLLQDRYRHPSLYFAGAVYNPEQINNLRHYSALYFHGHSVGGTNPSLLEAMACRCNIMAHDNIFNRAVLTDCANYFSDAAAITRLIGGKVPGDWARRNMDKIRQQYNWPAIINGYEQLFYKALENKKNGHL